MATDQLYWSKPARNLAGRLHLKLGRGLFKGGKHEQPILSSCVIKEMLKKANQPECVTYTAESSFKRHHDKLKRPSIERTAFAHLNSIVAATGHRSTLTFIEVERADQVVDSLSAELSALKYGKQLDPGVILASAATPALRAVPVDAIRLKVPAGQPCLVHDTNQHSTCARMSMTLPMSLHILS